MEAAIPGSADDTPAAQQVANDDLRKQQANAEKENVRNMLGGLPPGKGLKTAFLKIEKTKLTAIKNAKAEQVAAAAAKMEDAKSQKEMGKLTQEGQALLFKQQKDAQKTGNQMQREGSAIKKEEKEIESQTPPGQSNDSQMYGAKASAEIADPSKIDKSKVAQAKADAAKTLKAMKNGAGEEVFMLD